MDIGKAIKTLRKNDSATQGEFSESIGVTQAYLSGIENGHKKPSTEVLENVAESMGISLPVLFWFAVEREDVAEEKQYIYDMLKPTIDNLITEVFS